MWQREKSYVRNFQNFNLHYHFAVKIDPMNSHNDLDYKTVTRIHCKNEYIVLYI